MAFTKVGTLTAGDTITAAGVNAGFAGWSTWVPTLVNITVGNGTQTARYTQAGRITHASWRLSLGSTSVIGSAPTVSLPVPSNLTLGSCTILLEDSGSGYYGGFAIATTTVVNLGALNAGSTYAGYTALTSAIPITWGTGDSISFLYTYEATS